MSVKGKGKGLLINIGANLNALIASNWLTEEEKELAIKLREIINCKGKT